MSAEQNVELIRAAFAAYYRGDTDGVLALCAEDIVITQWQIFVDEDDAPASAHPAG